MSLSSTQQLCALGALLAVLRKHDLLAGGGGEVPAGGGLTPLMSVESIAGAHVGVGEGPFLGVVALKACMPATRAKHHRNRSVGFVD